MFVQFIGRVGTNPEKKQSKSGNEYYQYRVVEDTRFGGSDVSTWYTIKDMNPRRIYGSVKKGTMLFINGEFAPVDAFNGNDGNIHLELTIFANSVTFVPGGRNQTTGNTIQPSMGQGSVQAPQMVVTTQPQMQTTPVYNTAQQQYAQPVQSAPANAVNEDLPF